MLGWVGERRLDGRRRRYIEAQRALRAKLDVSDQTAVAGFEGQRERLAEAAGTDARVAATSGSTGRPKEVPYADRRLRAAKWAYIDAYCRMVHGLRISRPSLYVFRALSAGDESSLTALMMAERGTPPRLSVLQAPYRLHHHPEVAELAQRFGAAAVRTTIMALSNPGVLYATNPSTLSAFFDSLGQDWERVRTFAAATLAGEMPDVLRRVESSGAEGRLEIVANADRPPPTRQWLPGLEAWCSWDGGYVAPYLHRLRDAPDAPLPRNTFRHVPMYSMSTEVIETVPAYGQGALLGFLPIAPDVMYELRLVDGGDDPDPHDAELIPPWSAIAGAEYRLIVSDSWGLRRYDTADIFRCDRLVEGLPDLRFARRAGIAWSFTGEKLTGEHVSEALARLGADTPITLIPSAPTDQSTPHYRAVSPSALPPETLDRLDTLIGELNPEYAEKRRSGRLGALRAEALGTDELARATSGESWQTQAKVLPLVPRPWEDLPIGQGPLEGIRSEH